MEIIPTIMQKSFREMEKQLAMVQDIVPLAQLDVMDGVFVKNKSWPYGDETQFAKMVKEKSRLPFSDKLEYEIDLMVAEPEHVIEDWMHLGVRRLIVHVESTKKLSNIVQDVAAHVTKAAAENMEMVSLGFAINTTTPTALLEPHIYDIDFVQCMGIAEIGKQGQPFDERVIGQIENIKKLHPEIVVSVDGSVNLKTAPRLAAVGATRLAVGSAIFESNDPVEAIAALTAAAS